MMTIEELKILRTKVRQDYDMQVPGSDEEDAELAGVGDYLIDLIDAEIERRNTPNKGRVRAYNDGFMHWINCWECGGILEVYKPGDMPGEVGNYCRFCGVKFE